ncbi:hypothetical protein O164_25960 [Pseudomonas taiwanensis SJ9]|uniref:Uncharacterized protein n=1 Tax=Pseudomonas taiwanensis SJ9 TaxID=1388762 RepID=V7D459_9PSED|nr:hypothetical protein O164_25960 [Pseudomonas taiwanensis SJ9]
MLFNDHRAFVGEIYLKPGKALSCDLQAAAYQQYFNSFWDKAGKACQIGFITAYTMQ